jgi:hypothetical protein
VHLFISRTAYAIVYTFAKKSLRTTTMETMVIDVERWIGP